MMTTFKCVVDASVGIKQFVPDPLSNKVNQLFNLLTNANYQFYVPDLFYIECTNILWKYVRAGQYAAVDIQKDLASLKAFPLNVLSTADLIEDAANIAIKHNISLYGFSIKRGAYIYYSTKQNFFFPHGNKDSCSKPELNCKKTAGGRTATALDSRGTLMCKLS